MSIHPGPHDKEGDLTDGILELRWDPSGQRFAFNMGTERQLLVMNADGSELRAVQFKLLGFIPQHLPVPSFAWSPDGRKFVFRSPYRATDICNYLAIGYRFETGSFPCVHGRNLFTSNVDGSELTRISHDFGYGMGELFWIR